MNSKESNRTQADLAQGNIPLPKHVKIDDKAVKKIAGGAVSRVEGVLCVEGSLTDMLKREDDVTKGIMITMSDDNEVVVNLKIITELGKNIPDIVQKITSGVTDDLLHTAGLPVHKVEVEVADIMTREEYDATKNKTVNPLL